MTSCSFVTTFGAYFHALRLEGARNDLGVDRAMVVPWLLRLMVPTAVVLIRWDEIFHGTVHAMGAGLIVRLLTINNRRTSLAHDSVFRKVRERCNAINGAAIAAVLFLTFAIRRVTTKDVTNVLSGPRAMLINGLSRLFRVREVTYGVGQGGAFMDATKEDFGRNFRFASVRRMDVLIGVARCRLTTAVTSTINANDGNRKDSGRLIAQLCVRYNDYGVGPQDNVIRYCNVLYACVFNGFHFGFPSFKALYRMVTFRNVGSYPSVLVYSVLAAM